MLLCTKNKKVSEGEGGVVCCYVQRTRKLVKEREEMFAAMFKEQES